MKRLVLLTAAVVLVATGLAKAQVPQKISYQGLLTTSSGSPVQDGSYNLRFDIYSLPTGGLLRYTETQNGVSVQRGTFSVVLRPSSSVFGESLFVEVTALAGPGIGTPVTFSPRSDLTSAPYALAPWAINSTNIYYNNGNVGIGTASPGTRLEVAGQVKITGGGPAAGRVLTSDASGLASWQTPSGGLPSGTSGQTLRHDGANWISNSQLFNNGINVGIGMTSPGSRLSVAGGAAIGGAYAGSTAPANGTIIEGNVGIGTTSPGSKLSISGGAAIGSAYAGSTAPANGTIIEGKVGVGTTAPVAKLDVVGADTALRAQASGVSANGTVGTYSHAQNSSAGSTFGGYFKTSAGGTGVHRGLYAGGYGSSPSSTYGIDSYADNNANGDVYGGYFSASDPLSGGTGARYGLVAYAYGFSTNPTYGSYGTASNTNVGSAMGGYFSTSASGTGTHYGVYGDSYGGSASSTYGIRGDAKNTSSGYAYGGYFMTDSLGTGPHYGVYAKGHGYSSNTTYGSYGYSSNASTGRAYGAVGQSTDDDAKAAGVQAIGNGVTTLGNPKAAALEIRNGAIRVSGTQRPAGTLDVPSLLTPLYDFPATPLSCPDCNHWHQIGLYTDVVLNNDLIVTDPNGTIILLTVESAGGECALFAQVLSKISGSATIRVASVGRTPWLPIKVHYQLINPFPQGE